MSRKPKVYEGGKPHRATGRPRGGARVNAGRPEGSGNVLPMGAIKAIKALRLRVPEEASDEIKELADRALLRVADVMEGKVHGSIAGPVLKAATHIREEVCGPVARTVNVNAKVGLTELLDEATKIVAEEIQAEVEEVRELLPEECEPVAQAPVIRKKGEPLQ